MSSYTDPSAYWEARLSEHFDLPGTGHILLGPEYNGFLYRVRLRALERALRSTGRSLRGARVLEIGCGSGFYTEYCARVQVRDYVGVDITTVSVSSLQGRFPEFRFVRADIAQEELDFRSHFDLVLVADVLFHIVDDRGFARAMRTITSALREGGCLVVSDVFPQATAQTADHVRHRSLRAYERELSKSGLRISRVEPIFAVLQPPAPLPRAAWPWKVATSFWDAGWRAARKNPVNHVLPIVLGWLDRYVLLPFSHRSAPNSKWLLAMKGDEMQVRWPE
jgi:SAM-dependent methyltransferase